MKFTANTIDISKQTLDCVIVGVFEDSELCFSAKYLNKNAENLIQNCIDQGDFIPKIGNTLLLSHLNKIKPKRVLIVGCGELKNFTESSYIQIVNSAFGALKQTHYRSVGVYLTELMLPNRNLHWLVRTCITQIAAVNYSFDEYKTEKTESSQLESICFHARTAQDLSICEAAIREGKAIANATKTTKNLGNTPSNICTPNYIAEQARQFSKQSSKLKIRIFDEKTLEKMGFGAFCAVSKGSEEPGKLILLEYRGGKKNNAPYALVGKGITFDTGGLSLKASANMLEMKYDMCGAATVLGVMQAIVELELPINVIGALACAENMPDGKATKPESVVKTLSGQTVEITNTDAEGRLVLCDALTYIEQIYKPKAIIDIATLTGAIVVALGRSFAGLFVNNEPLAEQLNLAGAQSYDRVWRLPLDESYQELLTSTSADMLNSPMMREANSIVAACFLSRFVKNTPWAHLDIAGTANLSGKEKSATGRSVSLLVQYLINQAAINQ